MDSAIEQCSNLDKQIEQVLYHKELTEKECRILCEKAREILQEESNLLHVPSEAKVNEKNKSETKNENGK